MSETAHPGSDADANQARASDPSASAWVSANAGTGKTEVLVKRCLRLFLAGARPEAILCLTYTKTAAAAMQNRLLKELAEWATMPPAALHDRLQALMGRPPSEENLRTARRLFALALEARGGLKIYTIHGFCERILQRFPLEAEVSPHFNVLDELAQTELRRLAFDTVLARAAKTRGGTLSKALDKITALTTEDYFRKVVDAVLSKRTEIESLVAHHGGEEWPAAEALALRQLLAVEEAEEDAIILELAGVMANAEIDSVLAALEGFDGRSKGDRETETYLREARSHTGNRRVAAFREIFLTDKGTPKKSVCGAAFADVEPVAADLLKVAQAEFARLALKLTHLRVAEASGALLALADAIHGDYERRKLAEAVLDYDDLIVKARNLLFRPGAGAWVLFKIDGGVDHILVDEAQDTNPLQWSIIERLAEEFFAGEGSSGKLRTLFAVGDEKQSIYSFQGADPARFGAAGREFRARVTAAQLTWSEVPLNLSFRSTEPVLMAVDRVFAKPPASQGLTSDAGAVIAHSAHRKGQAGLVELWELETEAKSEPAPPFEPWKEKRGGASAVEALCLRMATLIKRWLTSGEELRSEGRKVRAGDILILVRRRDPFSTPMVRALKRAGVPVAGADRMRLMDQLVVQDLVALADVLLMPEDDLALAVVLKSPLFGLDDDALFDLAYGRDGSLWKTLTEKAKHDDRFAEAAERLSAWLGRTGFTPPYEFFLALLGENGQTMRKRLLNRLGPEAAEALDEFLDRALLHDRETAPSLQGFIDQLRFSDIEIKRDMEQERDEVRIMTVHGAKGLQAPIVFLPDTCMTPRPQGPRIFPLPRANEPPGAAGHLIWPPTGHSELDVLAAAKAALRQEEHEEYHRLLYVAMTRARDRLYVCGWQGVKQREKDCWYDLIADGLSGTLTESTGDGGRKVWRLENASTVVVPAPAAKILEVAAASLPDWALRPAAPERPPFQLRPSRIGTESAGGAPDAFEQAPLGPKDLADNSRFSRGRLVHALLQYLPSVDPPDQEQAARAFVAARGAELPQAMREEIVAECLAILRDPRFAPLFAPGSFGEVPLVAKLGGGGNAQEISGQIDRLAILDGGLFILDYKTNRPPPSEPEEVAPGYIAQLAAYRLALREMFPDLPLRAAIIWTDGPKLMEIPSTLLDVAERRILSGILDVTGVRT